MPIKAGKASTTPRPQTKRPTQVSRDFIEAVNIPGFKKSDALTVAKEKQRRRATAQPGMKNGHKKNKVILENKVDGIKDGVPDLNHIKAYNKSQILRKHIEERKKLVLEFCNVTPEMVLGATAMRAFASIDGAYDDHGRFNMKLARESGAVHLIKKLEQTPHGIKAEFYSNESAQQQLANYLGMEFAPRDNNDDVDSLKAGVEAVAKEIARVRATDVTHEIRVEAWERVARWVQESKARYSPQALEEVGKQYGMAVKQLGDGSGGFGDGAANGGPNRDPLTQEEG